MHKIYQGFAKKLFLKKIQIFWVHTWDYSKTKSVYLEIFFHSKILVITYCCFYFKVHIILLFLIFIVFMYWSQHSSILWGNHSCSFWFYLGSWEVDWLSYFIFKFSIQYDITLHLSCFPTSSAEINLSCFSRSFADSHCTYFRIPILYIVSFFFLCHLLLFTLASLDVYFYFIVPKPNTYFIMYFTGCLKSIW